jgi:hypothetical protein
LPNAPNILLRNAEASRETANLAGAANDDMRAMFVPLQELESLAPGTWYVNVQWRLDRPRG